MLAGARMGMIIATPPDGSPLEVERAAQSAARDRRLAIIEAVGDGSAPARNEAQALSAFVSALETARDQVPFALVYLLDEGATATRLAATVGGLDGADDLPNWPLPDATTAEREVDLGVPSSRALVIPLRRREDERC